ncbi:hypothetical protein NDU88_006814 [Pleurodeles waltl]|uniref:Uncharacterized protein n=1 Tax=Pleurodeles waltl TaxID=8319 RepID=A0AAV7MNE5_PLEWA|nr:hypothetical protein NDU88_006814 [Pleurodeles waltl]
MTVFRKKTVAVYIDCVRSLELENDRLMVKNLGEARSHHARGLIWQEENMFECYSRYKWYCCGSQRKRQRVREETFIFFTFVKLARLPLVNSRASAVIESRVCILPRALAHWICEGRCVWIDARQAAS